MCVVSVHLCDIAHHRYHLVFVGMVKLCNMVENGKSGLASPEMKKEVNTAVANLLRIEAQGVTVDGSEPRTKKSKNE